MKNYLLLCIFGFVCCTQTALAQSPSASALIPKEMQVPLAVKQVIPVSVNIKQVHVLDVRKPLVVSVTNVQDLINKKRANCPSVKAHDATLVLDAEKANSFAANLKWETKYAFKASGFSVERSLADTFHFAARNYSVVKKGKGVKNNYQLPDYIDYSGIAFFRIKQLNTDSGYVYSNIALVKGNEVASPLKIYPNPASAAIRIEALAKQTGDVSLVLYDASGKIMQQQTLSCAKDTRVMKSLDVSQLANGFYQVKIIMPDKTFMTGKFMKE